MEKTHKAAFLDRDGVINVDKDYLYRIEDFEYEKGALKGLQALQDAGYLLVIITNQSGIARGYYTEEDYKTLEEWMLADLSKRGIHIAGCYYCPHYPQAAIGKYRKDCSCRKPKTGLFYQAAWELSIDFNESIAIGDKERDLSICLETGTKGFLLCKDKTVKGTVQETDASFTVTDWEGICSFLCDANSHSETASGS